ncbi:MAG TPA: Sua5/YciO/YrdC/YwlC family protein [Sulfuricurvum sp.]|nr:Sua5/YciO/YrdC/YwlC family protein [Sulfuricurvum sp.]
MSIILAQTDTTVGFLSQDSNALAHIKGRESTKPFLKVFASLSLLQSTIRVPIKYRTFVRHARRTTFVIKNQAIRYVNDPSHARLIQKYGWLYSTSANPSGREYDREFCISHSDMLIEDSRGFTPCEPSHIYRLTPTQFKKLR